MSAGLRGDLVASIVLKIKVENQIMIKEVDISESTFDCCLSSGSETVFKAGDSHQGRDSEWALKFMTQCAGEKLNTVWNEKWLPWGREYWTEVDYPSPNTNPFK